jgi:Haem-NO-binding
MKGIVFVELLAMADHALGEDAVDGVIARCPLSSKGAYTAVGTYPSSELGQLVDGFSHASGDSIPALQRAFGHWMLRRFAATFPVFFEVQQDAFTMLESIENEVHAEVRKLYPDAELPTFDTVREGDDTLVMTYRSPRRLIDFCHGLIEECLVHFGEQASITCTDLSTAEMGVAEFRIVRKAA